MYDFQSDLPFFFSGTLTPFILARFLKTLVTNNRPTASMKNRIEKIKRIISSVMPKPLDVPSERVVSTTGGGATTFS